MDFVKKISPPWIAVAVLVVIVLVLLFRQRRSGFTPTAGAPITLMDLQEYSVFSPMQKTNYVNKLMAYQPMLSNAASTNSMMRYKTLLDEVMAQGTMVGPMPLPIGTQTKCPRGQFSPTGNQPGCMPCPINTYCPNEGMTAPLVCPYGTTSLMGTATTCTPTPSTGTRTKCDPGMFSPYGYQPGCIPCPLNTFCPNQGTATPTPCPDGMTSPMGSIAMTMCMRPAQMPLPRR
jgi:hypothetical protein